MEAVIEREAPTYQRDLSEYFNYWKSITVDNAKLSASTFLLHDLILNRDPKKHGFSPITNKNKLANGAHAWQGLRAAAHPFKWDRVPTIEQAKMLELTGLSRSTISGICMRLEY